MSFGAPEWFFLLPALIVLGWRVPALRLREPLRALALVALVVVLADPRLKIAGGGLDLWVLVDRSDSNAAVAASQAPEIATILERAKHREDRVFYIDYAVDAVRRDQGDTVFRGGTQLTRTGAALEFTLGQLAPDRAARILALTDGFATEPLAEVAEKVLRRGVPLDYRITGERPVTDYRVGELAVPARVLPGEAFLVEFSVLGATDGAVPWEVSRGGKVAAQGVAEVRGGAARVRLTDRLGGGGAVRYEVRTKPVNDAHPENDVAGAWVEVAGGSRVVLVSNYPDDPLAALLRSQGVSVEVATEPATLSPSSLTGARLVVINNVPAHRIASGFLGALDFFVREQGGGLLMVGGENSFGAGGYFSSAIDPLLPVSMELRKEHRKLATAMSIVMDRSGSMAASAGGGLTKMDLANTGAARAIELLGDFDAVSVDVIDSSSHPVVELAQVGPNRGRMVDSVRRIVSAGGGIYINVGLRAGWAQLQKAQTGQRHLVLFADAADSEEPGDYKDLIAEMRAAGATISVIGLGSERDSDAALLRDIAARGGGRMFFNADPAELPAVFAQETVSVARSAFIKEETPAQGTPGWAEIAARSPQWLASVDGYNLSYLRPGATASLVTTDEYQAPLVAAWARGAGRTAAVSFPLGGPHSERVRAWAGYGDFVQTLARWLIGEDMPQGMALRSAVSGGRLTLDLLYDETWNARIAQAAPIATVAEGGAARGAETVRPLVWEKIEPGRFRASVELTPDRWVRGAVRMGAVALPFGPIATGVSPEWSFDRARVQELKQLSERSGGRERLDLATVWNAPRPETTRSVRLWVLAAWLALLLADALVTRLEVSLLPRRKSAAAR